VTFTATAHLASAEVAPFMAKKHRAQWKGYLRLSLVSIGVEIYTAVESKSDIQFRQIHKPSGRRVNYEKVVKGVGKIESDDIVKGYEVDADTYVILEPEEIDALKLESKKTIDLSSSPTPAISISGISSVPISWRLPTPSQPRGMS